MTSVSLQPFFATNVMNMAVVDTPPCPQPAKKGQAQSIHRVNANYGPDDQGRHGYWYHWLVKADCDYDDDNDPYIRDWNGYAIFSPIWAYTVEDAIRLSTEKAVELYKTGTTEFSDATVKELQLDTRVYLEELQDEYGCILEELYSGAALTVDRYHYLTGHRLSLHTEIEDLKYSIGLE